MSTDVNAVISVRPATTADAPLLLTMIRELAEFERLTDKLTVTVESLERWLWGPQAVAQAVIAECGGRPAGYAVHFRYFSTFRGGPGMYLEDLYVREAFRGKHIGEALLRHVASQAIEQECARLEWVVLDWNENAIGFYRNLGAGPDDAGWIKYAVAGEALARLAEPRA